MDFKKACPRKGCLLDNSPCEDFFGRMKNEMFYGNNISIEKFTTFINEYIGVV